MEITVILMSFVVPKDLGLNHRAELGREGMLFIQQGKLAKALDVPVFKPAGTRRSTRKMYHTG